METKKPKPKKTPVPHGKSKLPLRNDKKAVGIFNGLSVTLPDLDSMMYIYEAGNFGKGNLSKGEPNYHNEKDDIPRVMLQHQFENQAKWNATTCHFQPQSFKRSLNNSFPVSLQSVQTFLQSSFREMEQDSWKTWKESHNQEFETVRMEKDSTRSDFLLVDEMGTGDYIDQDFVNMVNGILQRKQILQPAVVKPKTDEVIVLNTSFDPSSDLSAADVESRFERLPIMPTENLNLNLEESFFLKSVLGCLNIVDLNFSEIGISDLWEKFNACNENFTERYITYHYCRSKGWVVRSGLKFGGDFLLYKDGPAYYHASYLVKVLDRRKKLTWREFLSMNRLVETYNKVGVAKNAVNRILPEFLLFNDMDLLLTNVLPTTKSDTKSFPDVLKNHSVQQIVVKRWFPSRERFSKADEV